MRHHALLALLSLVPALAGSPARAGTVRNPDSPFGVICPWPGIGDSGVRWIRCGAGATALDWGGQEKARGVFDWSAADDEIGRWRETDGLDLLPILGYTPKWASSGPNGEYTAPPKDLKDWSQYVGSIVGRYEDRVGFWEVWNEENTVGFWNGSIGGYVDLLKSAYTTAKSADPRCRIVFGGTAGVDLRYTDRTYEYGAKDYFDVMAVHPYQWGDTFNDEWFASQLRDLHALMAKHGDGRKEIWLTEFGWSNGDPGITEEVQARLLAQAFVTSLTLRDANVTKAFWFSVKDWGGPGYGLVRDDGSRKPAFGAYRFVTRALDGADYVRSASQGPVRCHIFAKNGSPVLVAWHADKDTSTFTLPTDRRWTSARRLNGSRVALTGSPATIEVGPEPVFVFGAGSIGQPQWTNHAPAMSAAKSGVWYSISTDPTTSRPYLVRGRRNSLEIAIHNDSPQPASVRIEARVGSLRSASEPTKIGPGDVKRVVLPFTLPSDAKTGLAEMRVTGSADGKPLPGTDARVRIADGPVVEFLANSYVESLYLHENNASGAAPSVRFSGNWTYKFDLSHESSAGLDLLVGAHQANEWRVLTSSDKTNWQVGASGKSTRSRHTIDVSRYAGGPLYVKIEGTNQQLEELVLCGR